MQTIRNRKTQITSRFEIPVARPGRHAAFFESQMFPDVFGQYGVDRPGRKKTIPVRGIEQIEKFVFRGNPSGIVFT
jgi:hypothetical protein